MATAALKDEQDYADELRGYLSDERWRLNNLYWIKDKKGNKIKLKLNWAQEIAYDNMWYLNIYLKARQLGMTTFIQIFMLDRCLFNPDTSAGVIAHNREDAQKFFKDKLKYAYDNLPEYIRNELAVNTDRANEMSFSNGSSISVGTSMRSGTLQYLHVSEFGKICAKYPDKAKEIVTGALNAVEAGMFVFIESTAEGQEGYFFEYCQDAENRLIERIELTELDYKFFFFPWWGNKEYKLSGNVIISSDMLEYFDKLEKERGIVLTQQQKNWYTKKAETQKDEMKREYPSTSREAFEQAVDGAYYSKEMAAVRSEGRLTDIAYAPQLPVHVFFDLGRNDSMALWFMQDYMGQFRFIRYIEGNGESIQFFIRKMQSYGYIFGEIYLPHDGDVTDLTRADNKTRADVVRAMGFRVVVVPRVPEKIEAIQAVRDILPRCYFDKVNAGEGVKRLDQHKKEWDDKHGSWKDIPFRGPAKHGADAFEQFARGYADLSGIPTSFEPTPDEINNGYI